VRLDHRTNLTATRLWKSPALDTGVQSEGYGVTRGVLDFMFLERRFEIEDRHRTDNRIRSPRLETSGEKLTCLREVGKTAL
jgi:hypothetical protein